MKMRSRRTLLQSLMIERHLTREQTIQALERRARGMGVRDFALSLRQLDRWLAGDVANLPRPSLCGVVEAEFGYPVQRLLDVGSDGRRDEPASTARSTWGTGYEERLLLQTAVFQPRENEDVNRRELLTDFAVLGLAAPLAGVEAVRQGLAAAVAGDGHAAHVDEWDWIVHEYARSYYVTPADRLLRDLTADLSVLQLHLGGADGTMQRGLARAGGQLAAIAASAWQNAGEAVRAGRWWRTARELADRSGDTE